MYIIAEVGSNFSSYMDCRDSIVMAKACGADAVKFQYFSQEKLYGFADYELITKRATGQSLPGELPFAWIPQLSEKARQIGIDFIVSVFDVDDVAPLAPYVDAFKVASCEFMYFDMYAEMKAIGKKIIASCGAHSYREVSAVMEVEGGKYAPDVLMYCMVEYPSRYHDLRHVKALADKYPGTDIGYSDHSRDVFACPLYAVALGAKVIEKHFRLGHIVDGADVFHSLDSEDFQRMVKAIRGEPSFDMHAYQNDAILKYKRRLKAITDIARGETLEYRKNYSFVRSRTEDTLAGGYLAIPKIEGRSATRAYQPGDPINPGDYGGQ